MKWVSSFRFALTGIRSCFTSETNFRIHLFAAVTVMVFGFIAKIAAAEWLAVGFCIVLVITMEMINTAIEKLCDVVHQELHPGIKMVKDMAAGAVLLAAVFSVITAVVIFLPKIMLYFK